MRLKSERQMSYYWCQLPLGEMNETDQELTYGYVFTWVQRCKLPTLPISSSHTSGLYGNGTTETLSGNNRVNINLSSLLQPQLSNMISIKIARRRIDQIWLLSYGILGGQIYTAFVWYSSKFKPKRQIGLRSRSLSHCQFVSLIYLCLDK